MVAGNTRLFLAGQKTLLNEWRTHASQNSPARRDCLDPSQFLSELAYISILEAKNDDFVFRISGTQIRRLIGRDARGMTLGKFPELLTMPAGLKSLQTAISCKTALSGVDLLGPDRVHFWLRLPARCEEGRITQVICHDRVLLQDELGDLVKGFSDIPAIHRAA